MTEVERSIIYAIQNGECVADGKLVTPPILSGFQLYVDGIACATPLKLAPDTWHKVEWVGDLGRIEMKARIPA